MRVSNHRTVDFFQLIKFHKYDWLMILFLAIIEGVILLWIPPFYRFVGKEMMSNLRYPFRSNTVPFWSVPIYSTLGPILIFLIYYFRKRDIHDLHHAILGLFFSLLLNAVITDVIKIAVGWPRPNFFWRCFPDGKEAYHSVTHKALCTGSRAAIREGHKSFPSGHTSWTYAGLGYLSWYLSGKLNLFDRKGHAAKLCIVFLLLMLATLVAISRVDDYWHRWQDVFVGAVIGLTMATCSYRQFFPAPYHAECTLPYPFFPLTTNQHAQEIERAGENEEQVGYDNKSLDVETGRRGGETTRNASPTNVKEFNISGRGSDM